MIALKIKTVDEFLGGDARIAANSAQHFASQVWAGAEAFGPSGYAIAPPARNGPAFEPPTGDIAAAKGRGKAQKADTKSKADTGKGAPPKAVQNIAENRCRGFNAGKCGACTNGRICPKNAKYLHYCTQCGAKHPVTECTIAQKRPAAGAWGDGWKKNKRGNWVKK
jgi:hypothetical protein